MNELELFKYEEKEVRIIELNGETQYVRHIEFRTKRWLGSKLFNSRKFNVTVSSPQDEVK